MLFKSIILFLVLAVFPTFPTGTHAQQTVSPTIYGQVFDSQGRPLQDAKVNLSSHTDILKQVQTDQTGQYEFRNLSLGVYCLTVDCLGFATEEKCIKLHNAGRELIDFGLEVGIHYTPHYPSRIIGEVTQTNGRALGGVVVRVINPFSQKLVAIGRTNPSGKFEISVNLGGQYVIYAHKVGFSVSTLGIDLDKWEEINLVMRQRQ